MVFIIQNIRSSLRSNHYFIKSKKGIAKFPFTVINRKMDERIRRSYYLLRLGEGVNEATYSRLNPNEQPVVENLTSPITFT